MEHFVRAVLLARIAIADAKGNLDKSERLRAELQASSFAPQPVMPRMPIGARSTTTPRHLPPLYRPQVRS